MPRARQSTVLFAGIGAEDLSITPPPYKINSVSSYQYDKNVPLGRSCSASASLCLTSPENANLRAVGDSWKCSARHPSWSRRPPRGIWIWYPSPRPKPVRSPVGAAKSDLLGGQKLTPPFYCLRSPKFAYAVGSSKFQVCGRLLRRLFPRPVVVFRICSPDRRTGNSKVPRLDLRVGPTRLARQNAHALTSTPCYLSWPFSGLLSMMRAPFRRR